MQRQFQIWMLYPFLVLLLAFLVDKLFFVGNLPDYFLRTASFINYEHKEDLLDELRDFTERNQEQRTLVILGNSRTLSFDNSYIEKNHPQWTLFNFSVPGGGTDYFLYLTKEIARRDIRPDALIVTVAPESYNANVSLAMDETMINGLPLSFVLQNIALFNRAELSNYLAKKLFWSYRYRPRLATIEHRLEENRRHLRQFRLFIAQTRVTLYNERGSVPYGHDWHNTDNELLTETAHQDWQRFLAHYQLSGRHLEMTRRSIAHASELSPISILLWPRVGGELRRLIDEEQIEGDKSVRDLFEPAIQSIANEHNAHYLDLNYNEHFQCDKFYDASHMAAPCFREFIGHIIDHIEHIEQLESTHE